MADYDGNIDKVADGNKISIYGWGKNILAFTGENTDTIVIDPHSGKQIRYVIRNDDEGLGISDISRNGDIALAGISACDLDDNSSAIRLIDTKTGQRVDCKIKTDDYCYLGFVDNDQKSSWTIPMPKTPRRCTSTSTSRISTIAQSKN